MSTPEWESLVATYENTIKWHDDAHVQFTNIVRSTSWMWQHRHYCDENKLGMGDHAFHYLWWLICQQVHATFRFLEIGVYRGQITSWVSMCAEELEKIALVCGITTESREPIDSLHTKFGVRPPMLYHGKSQSEGATRWASLYAPFDIVYIDGGHSHDEVVYDIRSYGDMLKLGGILVMDDASCGLNMPSNIWRGQNDVYVAAKNQLDNSKQYRHLFAIGHNRIYERVTK